MSPSRGWEGLGGGGIWGSYAPSDVQALARVAIDYPAAGGLTEVLRQHAGVIFFASRAVPAAHPHLGLEP